MYKRYPYKNNMADAYCTAVNILAVEYLIKTNNQKEYERRCLQVCELTDIGLECLHIRLSLNMHTSNLGAMITQGDYDNQVDALIDFLDNSTYR